MASQSTTRTRTGERSNTVAGQLLAGQLAAVGCSLVINILSARAMGPAGRGHLALLLQISYAATTLTLAGVDRTYAATVTPPNPKPRRAIRDLTRLTTPPTLAATAVILLAGPLLGASWPTTIAIAVTSAGTTAALVLRTSATASRFGRLYLSPITGYQLTLLSISVGLFWWGSGSVDLWLWAYAAAFAALPVAAWTLTRNTPRSRRTHLQQVRRAGLHVLPGSIASSVMLRSDRLLLPILGTFEQAGWYAVTATLTEVIVWPVLSYVDSHMPQWRAAGEAGTLRRRRVLGRALVYAVVAACAVTAVGWVIIVPVFGAAFQPSLVLLLPLAAAAGVYGVSRVAVALDVATGRLRTAMHTDLPAVAVSVALYLILIPHLGAMGAAYGSLAGYSTAALISTVLALRPAEA